MTTDELYLYRKYLRDHRGPAHLNAAPIRAGGAAESSPSSLPIFPISAAEGVPSPDAACSPGAPIREGAGDTQYEDAAHKGPGVAELRSDQGRGRDSMESKPLRAVTASSPSDLGSRMEMDADIRDIVRGGQGKTAQQVKDSGLAFGLQGAPDMDGLARDLARACWYSFVLAVVFGLSIAGIAVVWAKVAG